MRSKVLFGFHSSCSAFRALSQKSSTASLSVYSDSSASFHSQENLMDRIRSTKLTISRLTLQELQVSLKLIKDNLRKSSSQETIINAQTLLSKLNTLTHKDYQSYSISNPFEAYYGYIAEIAMLYQVLNQDTDNADRPGAKDAILSSIMPDETRMRISSHIVNIVQTSLTFLNEYPDLTLDNFYAICHLLNKSGLNRRVAPVYFTDIIKKLSISYANITSLCSNPYPFLKELFFASLGDILKNWEDSGLTFKSVHAEAFKRRLTYYFSAQEGLNHHLIKISSLADCSTGSSLDSDDYSGPERKTIAFDFM